MDVNSSSRKHFEHNIQLRLSYLYLNICAWSARENACRPLAIFQIRFSNTCGDEDLLSISGCSVFVFVTLKICPFVNYLKHLIKLFCLLVIPRILHCKINHYRYLIGWLSYKKTYGSLPPQCCTKISSPYFFSFHVNALLLMWNYFF